MPITFSILRKYRNRSDIFIETGTHMGSTTEMARQLNFKEIYTIELSDYFYKQACVRFRKYSNIHPILGESIQKLPIILKEITQPCLFWLDAHWSEGITALGSEAVPLYSELEIIAKHPVKTHTILIDDIRLMGAQWENISCEKVKELLLKINNQYTISFEDGFLIPEKEEEKVANDIIVATI